MENKNIKYSIYNYEESPILQETKLPDLTAEEMLVLHYEKLLISTRKYIYKYKDKSEENKKHRKNLFYQINQVINSLRIILSKEDIKNKKEYEVIFEIFCKFKSLLTLFPEEILEIENQKKQIADKNYVPPPPEKIIPIHQLGSLSIKRILKISNEKINNDLKKCLLSHYCEKIKDFLNKKELECSINNNDIEISKNKKCIIIISTGDNGFINDIYPVGSFAKKNPYISKSFYQKVFHPIFNMIGHFCLNNNFLFIINKSYFPDITNENRNFKIKCLSFRDKCEKNKNLIFKDNIWLFENKTYPIGRNVKKESNSNNLTEKDFFSSRVQCIDSKQKMIFGKIGDVIQIIPRPDYIELDINFGRHIVRLTSEQVKIISEL